MAYATYADIEARWRPLSADEQTLATTLLDDAAVILDATYPPSDPIAAQEAATRKLVSCQMVQRVLEARASDDSSATVTQDSKTWGPFSWSQSFGSAGRTGSLYISRDEKNLLAGRGRQVAFMVDLAPMEDDDLVESSSS